MSNKNDIPGIDYEGLSDDVPDLMLLPYEERMAELDRQAKERLAAMDEGEQQLRATTKRFAKDDAEFLKGVES